MTSQHNPKCDRAAADELRPKLSTNDRAYSDRGVVLRTYPFGEADRVVIVMTAEHGKIRAVAKGSRRTKSRFAALTQPCSHGEIGFYRGRSKLETITQIVPIDLFAGVQKDLDRLVNAMAMLETVDYFAQDSEPNRDLYKMLVGGLRTVAESNPALTLGAFLLRVLCVEGFAPEITRCTSCASTQDLVSFEITSGGTRCRNCRQGIPIGENHLKVLSLITQGRTGESLSLPASPVISDINEIAVALVEHHAERRLKALEITRF